MSKIKKIKYKNVFIMIFIVAIFMFRYVRDDIHLEGREYRDSLKMQYNNEVAFAINDDSRDICELEDLFGESCNISLVDISLFLDDTGYCYISEVVLSDGEECIYPIIKGEYPSDTRLATGKPCVVLGKSLYQYTYTYDGKTYIKICGDEYEVTGYISMEESSVLDHRVLLFYDCLGQGVKEELGYLTKANALVCIVGSSSISKEELGLNAYKVVASFDNTFIYNEYYKFVESKKLDVRFISYAKLIFIFSLANMLIFGNFWMLQYRQEIAIKKNIRLFFR